MHPQPKARRHTASGALVTTIVKHSLVCFSMPTAGLSTTRAKACLRLSKPPTNV